jgi:NAD(P)-dependent dehydrogenase (short-subunit alcohol dehydrogenase family)
VAATARDTSTLDDLAETHGDRLLPIALDVTDREADIAAVRAAHERFGRLDVVVNNAGYGQFGLVEEISEAEARAQFETNVFGALWITQAALPYLREQRGGHIVQVSSIPPGDVAPVGAAVGRRPRREALTRPPDAHAVDTTVWSSDPGAGRGGTQPTSITDPACRSRAR